MAEAEAGALSKEQTKPDTSVPAVGKDPFQEALKLLIDYAEDPQVKDRFMRLLDQIIEEKRLGNLAKRKRMGLEP